MSLINQMLRDLDQRRTSQSADSGQVQVVRQKRVPIMPVLVVTIGVCALLAAAVWWFFPRSDSAPEALVAASLDEKVTTPKQSPGDAGLPSKEKTALHGEADRTKKPVTATLTQQADPEPITSLVTTPATTTGAAENSNRSSQPQTVTAMHAGQTSSKANASREKKSAPTSMTDATMAPAARANNTKAPTTAKPGSVVATTHEQTKATAAQTAGLPSVKQPAVLGTDEHYRKGRAAAAQGRWRTLPRHWLKRRNGMIFVWH